MAETRAELEASRRFIAELQAAEEARRVWVDPAAAAHVAALLQEALELRTRDAERTCPPGGPNVRDPQSEDLLTRADPQGSVW